MGNGATWGRFEPRTENPNKMNYEFNNHGHNNLRLSPQVKQSVDISNKYGIYKLPHELPND